MNDVAFPPSEVVEAFAGRIKRAHSGRAYRGLRDELRAQPDHGLGLLLALASHPSEQVRAWAGGVARKDLGRDGLPVLMSLATHRRSFTRDLALQELEALDPELLRQFIPDMRRMVRRADQLFSSPGTAAMWRLVRLHDRESAPVFRAFAAKRDPRFWEYRMPNVLADYLEDEGSIARRIEGHDHDWMLWLAMAAAQIDAPGGEAALAAAASSLPDAECRQICEQELRSLRRRRTVPSTSWDIETLE